MSKGPHKGLKGLESLRCYHSDVNPPGQLTHICNIWLSTTPEFPQNNGARKGPKGPRGIRNKAPAPTPGGCPGFPDGPVSFRSRWGISPERCCTPMIRERGLGWGPVWGGWWGNVYEMRISPFSHLGFRECPKESGQLGQDPISWVCWGQYILSRIRRVTKLSDASLKRLDVSLMWLDLKSNQPYTFAVWSGR